MTAATDKSVEVAVKAGVRVLSSKKISKASNPMNPISSQKILITGN